MWLFGFVCSLLLGAMLGSCANLLVLWMYDHSRWSERFHCPGCLHPYRVRHRVPLIAWLFWWGKCDHCGRSIHIQKPWMEIAMMLLSGLAYARLAPFVMSVDVMRFVIEILFLFSLLVCTGFDLRWKLLPVEFLGSVALILFILNGWTGLIPWMGLIWGILFGVIFLGFQFLISDGRWMGGGDVLLGAMIGVALGWPMIGVAFYFAYVFGGLILLMFWSLGMLTMKSRIPFGPVLAGGACLALWFGQSVLLFAQTLFLR